MKKRHFIIKISTILRFKRDLPIQIGGNSAGVISGQTGGTMAQVGTIVLNFLLDGLYKAFDAEIFQGIRTCVEIFIFFESTKSDCKKQLHV